MYGVEMICFTSEGIAHRSFIELLDDNNPEWAEMLLNSFGSGTDGDFKLSLVVE